MKKLTVRRAEVHWIDSVQDIQQVWWDVFDWLEEFKKRGEVFKSTGYVFYRNKKILAMATSIHYADDKIQKVGTVFTIPIGCITKIKWL